MIENRNTKTQAITRGQVWRAYKSVNKNSKAAGVDNMSMHDFKNDKEKQIYKIWNRMSSGSYFPPPIKEAEIPKKDGSMRKLGLPTVGDRVAQMVVKHQIEYRFERNFHEDSHAYRPKKDAHGALTKARERCLQYDWGIDLDIKGFFDNIDHDLLLGFLAPNVDEKWAMLYIKRWLKVPVISIAGEKQERKKGTPQGGVISPLLANIYLHFVFDQWMKENKSHIKFERYADDIIIHCSSYIEAETLLVEISKRMEDYKLKLHPDKTQIFYCKDYRRNDNYKNVSFTFLSHTFKPRRHKSKFSDGFFLGFSPAISIQAMKEKVLRVKELYRQFFYSNDIKEIAKLVNSFVKGWITYYGRANFWKIKPIFDNLNFRLAKWLKRTNKRFKYSIGKSFKHLKYLQKLYPHLFVHWRYGFIVH